MSNAVFPDINAIAAMGENRAISKNNKLPWRIREELEWFREKTKGNTLLIGRLTFESMGGAAALPNCKIIVLSSGDQKFEGAEALTDWRNLKPIQIQGELFVGGGERVYAELMPYVKNLYLTHVFLSPEADRFFPTFEDKFTARAVLKETDKFKVVHYENKNPLPFPGRAG